MSCTAMNKYNTEAHVSPWFPFSKTKDTLIATTQFFSAHIRVASQPGFEDNGDESKTLWQDP